VTELWDTVLHPLLPSDNPPHKPPADLYPDILHKDFECVVNGTKASGQGPLRDFTVLATSSFAASDHVRHQHVLLRPDVLFTTGTIRLRHARTFISWTRPVQEDIPILLPYSATAVADANTEQLRTVHFVCPLIASLLKAGMPAKLRPVLLSPDSVKMFCSLRGIGVKPEIITYNALLGVAVRTASWGQALAIK